MGRVLKATAIVLGVLVALAIVAVLVITRTDFGHERVRRLALGILEDRVDGQVQIGSVSGNLLRGVTLHDVVIADSAGAPFIAIDEAHTGYGLRALLEQRVILDDVVLVRPVIVIDKPPDGEWNVARIFPGDTAATESDTSGGGWGDWIVLNDVRIEQGLVIIRSPWEPDSGLAPAVRDSTVAAVLAGAGRSEVVPAVGGWQEVMQFRDIDAVLGEVRLAHPEHESMLIAVDSLVMVGEPFRPPVIEVHALRGEIEFTGDSLWFGDARAQLPGSVITGGGKYVFDPGDMRLDLHGEPVALADLRWLYPRLPSQGSGTLDFVMNRHDDTATYIARDADIVVRDSRLAGDFGLTLADDPVFHDTDLRVTTLDTRLIEQLVPQLDLPLTGTLSGRAALAGPLRAMQVDGDLTLDEARGGRSRVIAVGEVGVGDATGFRARGLRVEARPVRMSLVRTFVEGLPLDGLVTGMALVNGSSRTQLDARTDIVYVEDGERSRVVGDARLRLAGEPWMDIDAQARPLALATVGQFTPLSLRGVATGPVRIQGTLRDLRVDTRMEVSGGGELSAEGRLDLTSAAPGYAMSLGFYVFNLNAVVAAAPVTSLSATATLEGRGTDPATMNAALAAHVSTSHWSEYAVDSGLARVAVADGLLRVDTLRLRAPNTRLDAEGAFGFRASRTGSLVYRLAIDSLADFARWLPIDTGVVAPRPARVAQARAEAAAEQERLMRATEVERAISGAPAPRVEADLPSGIPRDSIAGSLYAAGTLAGNLGRFDLAGRASVLDLTLWGNQLASARAEYRIAEGGSDAMRMILAAEASRVTAGGFEFDSVEARVVHRDPTGDFLILVRQGDERAYLAEASYALSLEQNEVEFSRLRFRFDTTVWAATQPGTVRWGGRGVEVDQFELRSGDAGRIYVDGLLPTEGAADLGVSIENFEIAHLIDLLQTDAAASGLVSVTGELTGTLSDPRFAAALGIVDATYGGTALPEVINGTVRYADASLTADVVASRGGGAPLARAEGTLPINLAFTGVTGSRLLDRPVRAELVADSLPLDVLPELTDQVTNVRGRVMGAVRVSGTPNAPVLAGALALDLGSFGIASTGTTVRDISGYLRLSGDSVVIDSLAGWSGGPVRLSGGLGVETWTTPSFDLRLDVRNAVVLDTDRGRLRADAALTMAGPFDDVLIEGNARIRGGVLYIPESESRDVVNARDPALFSIVDTATVEVSELVPEQSPLLRNLRMNVALRVDRDTWVRPKEGNVEVYGDLNLIINQRRSSIAVEGSLNTDRGEYTFLSKRFEVRNGSATFIGSTDIDPTLQVTGNYEVPIPGREALNIRVLIGGTLSNPKLTLESDAQPPISQTDLLSYLAFGRSSSTLLSPGSGLSGAGAGGELIGAGAALAGRQLTGVALGVAVEELEGEASRSAGLDVFNITPGSLPPEFWRADLEEFLMGTEVEAGRYLSPSFFLAVQQSIGWRTPGIRGEYRFGRGLQLQGNLFTTRHLTSEPTLRETELNDVASHGLLLIKEWRFSSRLSRPEPQQPVPGRPIGTSGEPPAAVPPNRDPE